MKILVTGAAGYLGSHTAVELCRRSYDVYGIDNFSKSHPEMMPRIYQAAGKEFPLENLDLCDEKALQTYFEKHPDFDGIIHFAAFKSVPESMQHPLMYYRNNLHSLTNLIHCVSRYSIPRFVFSSSCSVYGNVKELPVTEETPLPPAESVYGFTKQLGEKIIRDCFALIPSKALLLRYFNPAGADESGLIGEWSKDEPMNLVPRITGFARGRYSQFKVFGTDYNTPDGSCIRDYIHVSDLATAHIHALEYAKASSNTDTEVFNIGTGHGYSVLELIRSFESISGMRLNWEAAQRREGDPVAIYANAQRAEEKLQWKATRNLDEMLRSSWQWEQSLDAWIKTGNK